MKTDKPIHRRQPPQFKDNEEHSMALEPRSEAGSQKQHFSEQTDGFSNGTFTQEEQWACRLGWFGIGLGLTELLVPERLGRMIGVPPGHEGLIRTMGLREVASSVGILTQRQPATATWSRVAGDVLDLALLGAAFTSSIARHIIWQEPSGNLAGTDSVAQQKTLRGLAACSQIQPPSGQNRAGAAMSKTDRSTPAANR